MADEADIQQESESERKTVGVYWKDEYFKRIVCRNYYDASNSMGAAFSYPTLDYLKNAYGKVQAFISSLPIPENQDDNRNARNGFLLELDIIGKMIYGDPCVPEVAAALRRHGVVIQYQRNGVRMVPVLQNLPIIANSVRDILIRSGEFATSLGLLITKTPKTEKGLAAVLKEEGMEDLDL